MKRKPIRPGEFVTRTNTERRFGSAADYEFIWARRFGKMCLFAFTKDSLNDAQARAMDNLEDMPMLKRGFFSWLKWGA